MAMSSFCGVLSLQVGVTVLAAVFFTLGCVVLVANVFEGIGDDEEGGSEGGGGEAKTAFRVKDDKQLEGNEDSDDEESKPDVAFLLIILFSIGFFVIGGLAFYSAYTETRLPAMVGLLTLVLVGGFWILFSVLSLLSHPQVVEDVCKEKRCPESLWLARLDYRKEGGDKEGARGEWKTLKLPDKILGSNKTNITDSSLVEFNNILNNSVRLNYLSREIKKNSRLVKGDKESEKQTDKKNDKKGDGESKYKFGLPLIAAICLFIINLIFFLFTALILYSWYQELHDIYYYVEEPYYIGPFYN